MTRGHSVGDGEMLKPALSTASVNAWPRTSRVRLGSLLIASPPFQMELWIGGSKRRMVAEADMVLCLGDGGNGEKTRRRGPHARHRDSMKSGRRKK
jgi:hypothetical protein